MTAECAKVRDLMDSYASGELLVETNHSVLAHLSACPACASELERRRRVTALLRESLDVPVDVDALRHHVGLALDRDRRRWFHARTWALAASVVVGVAALLFVTSGTRVDAAAYRDSVGDHVECALTLPAGVTYDAARIARRLQPQFAALAEAMQRMAGPYRLVDAHKCPYRGRDYAHFVFRDEGRTLSIFVEDQIRGALPKTADVVTAPSSSERVYHLDEQGYHVAATATESHQIFVITDRQPGVRPALPEALLRSAAPFVRALEPIQVR